MNRLLCFLPFLAALILSGCGDMAKGRPAADFAVERFHELYNAEDYDLIWNEADPKFRAATQKANYLAFMKAATRKLGSVRSTKNKSWSVFARNFATTVSLKQQTVFEQGEGTEDFTFVMSKGQALLLHDNLQSLELVTK